MVPDHGTKEARPSIVTANDLCGKFGNLWPLVGPCPKSFFGTLLSSSNLVFTVLKHAHRA